MKAIFLRAPLEASMIKFNLVVGALGDQKADAIVTAATQELNPLSDYYSDVLEKAGPELHRDIIENGYSCEVGDALVTSAFNLDADVIVHAVPPSLDSDEDNGMSLVATYTNAIISEFARHFGKPKLELTLDEKKSIVAAKILRGSPCGSSHYTSRRIVGLQAESAVPTAGLMCLHYPCLASMQFEQTDNGVDTIMHTSGRVFNEAMEKALKPFSE
jgi:hypothetical protein